MEAYTRYAAMDVGGFYRNNSLMARVPYFAILPNVSVRELEISYGRTLDESRMRAATFGRGLWETPLYKASPVVFARESGAPVAEGFSAGAEKGGRGVAIRCGTAVNRLRNYGNWRFSRPRFFLPL